MKSDDMPLLEVSPVIKDLEPASRKRSHDEFSDESRREAGNETQRHLNAAHPSDTAELSTNLSSAIAGTTRDESRGAPTNDGPISPTNAARPPIGTESIEEKHNATHPGIATTEALTGDTPSSLNSHHTLTLPVKRKRLTGAEKEARDKELAEQKRIREQQSAEKAALKAAEKAKLEEAKAARAKERDQKRRKKEEEQQRLQEEKDRKARSQKTLGSFFKIPIVPKKPTGEIAAIAGTPANGDAAAPIERPVSAYSAMFKPFFVKDNTRLAPILQQMDKATQESKSRDLDRFISSAPQDNPIEFRPRELLGLVGVLPCTGRFHRPVKHIMEWAYKESQKSGATGVAEANRISGEVREQLKKIPMKVISFSQDVRPPYCGTQTLKIFCAGKVNMQRLARRSTSRILQLDYDYDSEAEWQEEEGEDVDIDDDEEELDDEDDMDGFLDDSEDTGLTRRVFGHTMEPESTGICFEDGNQIGPDTALWGHKMEFMLGTLKEQSIDPFSTRYWEPEPVPLRTKQSRAFRTEPMMKTEAGDAKAATISPVPANAFAAIRGPGSHPTQPGPPSGKLVKAELMNDFKRAILDNKALSKVGIIDIIFHKFRNSVSRAEVKNTLEVVAEKKGAGRTREWELRPGHEIIM